MSEYMNERIKELKEQALIWAVETLDPDALNDNEWGVAIDEKFAELIIKECARVARATPAPNFHWGHEDLKQQLGHTWDMSAVESGREIIKHFGVEE